MKKLFILLLFLRFTAIQAQEEPPKNGWTKGGNFTFTLNQSSFSNWVSGGDNAVAGNALINYNANLVKNTWNWDNKIILAYGMANTASKGTIKTDDRIELNSLVGKKASGHWYYSLFTSFLTQFSDGYDYKQDPKVLTSRFFAPAYLSFGPGMLWKKSDNFKINLSPATGKLTLVMDKTLSDAGAFGVDPGKTSRMELGFYGSVYHKAPIMKNITLENILNVYSNYMEEPQNIDVNHQLSLVMQVNKYISANLNLHTIYDDNMSTDIQFKEVFGIGFNYAF